ncbi:hypothetical protein [Paenibacillus sp. GCM10027626]|uniref:hypothetical protein n=1 Tax=Paenibacillus sp. GCM10027626 TaxID=3273411 RepID=UPI00362F15BD
MKNIVAGSLKLELSSSGHIVSLKGIADGKEYAPVSSGSGGAPLIHAVVDGKLHDPSSVVFNEEADVLSFFFADGAVQIDVGLACKERYATFEVTHITDEERVDTVIWGPYATAVAGSIGESVGVVHDGEFAIGIQALNIKTVGGWPIELERLDYVQPSYSGGHAGQSPDPDSRQPSDNKFEYDVCAAWPANEGSLLQAFARNRTKAGRRAVWNLPDVAVPPIGGEDARIVGTKIALFGCPASEVLETIEEIELGEGLPHPTFGGVWGKISPEATRSYLITDFSEATMGEAVRYTKLAGLKYVYHPDPFAAWGHFTLKPGSFPNGDESLKACVEAAESAGVHVGLHTLSNFTTLNDAYVTPVPDERLQLAGVARLASAADADAQELEVDDPAPFTANLFRYSARIGNELIEYEGVTDSAPWKLLGVTRGANGTTAAAHDAGAVIGRVWDHPYDVFFPNNELQDAYSERLSRLYATAGLKQISFDGLEGVYATGQDGYGVNRFVKQCYDGWGDEVINDASIVVPNYLWHIFTRFNWGEPWGAATREGQLEWRLSNQRYFARNFIPPMLGWFLVRSASDRFEATTLDEIEWVLSKAAGFGAGFALVADMAVLRRNGNSELLLAAVREWEEARQAGAFTAEQRKRLCEPQGDWHLEPAGEGSWRLYPVARSKPLVCSPAELQPGQPGGSDWALFNPHAAQALAFIMRVNPSYGNEDASVKRPTFYTDGTYMTFDTEVMAGQYLVCEGGRIGSVYDRNWNLLKTVEASADAPIVKHGGQTLSFSCKFNGNPKPEVSVTVLMRGEPEAVGRSV